MAHIRRRNGKWIAEIRKKYFDINPGILVKRGAASIPTASYSSLV